MLILQACFGNYTYIKLSLITLLSLFGCSLVWSVGHKCLTYFFFKYNYFCLFFSHFLLVVYVTALQLLAFLVVIGNAIVYSVHYKSSRLNGMSDKRHASSSTCLRHTKISPAKEISETSENEANSECASDVCVVTPVRRPSKMASSAEKLNTYFVVTHIVLFMLVTSVTLVISFLT